jgi:hypothetical protein
MDRWKVADAEALELIRFAGKLGKSGKRPRFRFITRQARLVSYLLEVDSALAAVGYDEAWLHRRVRAAPYSGRPPLSYMIEGQEPAIADVLSHLVHLGLTASLRQDG